jgi:hypothetical protein
MFHDCESHKTQSLMVLGKLPYVKRKIVNSNYVDQAILARNW